MLTRRVSPRRSTTAISAKPRPVRQGNGATHLAFGGRNAVQQQRERRRTALQLHHQRGISAIAQAVAVELRAIRRIGDLQAGFVAAAMVFATSCRRWRRGGGRAAVRATIASGGRGGMPGCNPARWKASNRMGAALRRPTRPAPARYPRGPPTHRWRGACRSRSRRRRDSRRMCPS